MPKTEAFYKVGNSTAWKVGVLGLLLRRRGLLAAAFFFAFLAVSFGLLFESNQLPQIRLNTKYALVSIVIAFGSIIIGGLYYLRNRTIRSLNVKQVLHEITHNIRDSNTQIHKLLLDQLLTEQGADEMTAISDEVQRSLVATCDNIASLFRLIKNNKGINAAVRLATVLDDGTLVYKTVARSEGLDKGREKSSEATPYNKGVPEYLRKFGKSQGVLVFYDMETAGKLGESYLLTKNDALYSEEIQSMMVAPLNAWAGSEQDMIGMLFVTSKEKSTFSIKDVDQLAFLADLVATSVSCMIELIEINSLEAVFDGGNIDE